jgi:hypothetical protein
MKRLGPFVTCLPHPQDPKAKAFRKSPKKDDAWHHHDACHHNDAAIMMLPMPGMMMPGLAHLLLYLALLGLHHPHHPPDAHVFKNKDTRSEEDTL